MIAPYNALSSSSGASLRVFELAKSLNRCGSSVYVLHNGPARSIKTNLKFINFKSHRFLVDSDNYFHPFNPSYPSQLQSFLKEYVPDIVQCENPWSVFPTSLLLRSFHILCALDEHNVEVLWSLHASRIPFVTPYTFAIEGFALLNSDIALATSEIDKKHISKIYKTPEEKIFVVPNGVNLQSFSAISSSSSKLKKKLYLDSGDKLVLFHGLMSARQNYEAARLISDLIAPKMTDVTFIIIGKNPPQWLLSKTRARKNVLILGFAPNVEEYIMAADVCIAPILRGSGTRLKVLEYLAAGKPVVATFKGAEGLPLVNRVHSLLFEGVDGNFVDGIKELLTNDSLAEELGSNARQLGMKFDWAEIANRLHRKYESLLARKR